MEQTVAAVAGLAVVQRAERAVVAAETAVALRRVVVAAPQVETRCLEAAAAVVVVAVVIVSRGMEATAAAAVAVVAVDSAQVELLQAVVTGH